MKTDGRGLYSGLCQALRYNVDCGLWGSVSSSVEWAVHVLYMDAVRSQ